MVFASVARQTFFRWCGYAVGGALIGGMGLLFCKVRRLQRRLTATDALVGATQDSVLKAATAHADGATAQMVSFFFEIIRMDIQALSEQLGGLRMNYVNLEKLVLRSRRDSELGRLMIAERVDRLLLVRQLFGGWTRIVESRRSTATAPGPWLMRMPSAVGEAFWTSAILQRHYFGVWCVRA